MSFGALTVQERKTPAEESDSTFITKKFKTIMTTEACTIKFAKVILFRTSAT